MLDTFFPLLFLWMGNFPLLFCISAKLSTISFSLSVLCLCIFVLLCILCFSFGKFKMCFLLSTLFFFIIFNDRVFPYYSHTWTWLNLVSQIAFSFNFCFDALSLVSFLYYLICFLSLEWVSWNKHVQCSVFGHGWRRLLTNFPNFSFVPLCGEIITL